MYKFKQENNLFKVLRVQKFEKEQKNKTKKANQKLNLLGYNKNNVKKQMERFIPEGSYCYVPVSAEKSNKYGFILHTKECIFHKRLRKAKRNTYKAICLFDDPNRVDNTILWDSVKICGVNNKHYSYWNTKDEINKETYTNENDIHYRMKEQEDLLRENNNKKAQDLINKALTET